MGDSHVEPTLFNIGWETFIRDFCVDMDLIRMGNQVIFNIFFIKIKNFNTTFRLMLLGILDKKENVNYPMFLFIYIIIVVYVFVFHFILFKSFNFIIIRDFYTVIIRENKLMF